MSLLLHNNFPKLTMQFVSLSLQIEKLCHNQLEQTKMVLLNKILHLKSEQFHVPEYIFDVQQYHIRPKAHSN